MKSTGHVLRAYYVPVPVAYKSKWDESSLSRSNLSVVMGQPDTYIINKSWNTKDHRLQIQADPQFKAGMASDFTSPCLQLKWEQQYLPNTTVMRD